MKNKIATLNGRIDYVDLETVYTLRHPVMYPFDSRDRVFIPGDLEADHYGYFLDNQCVSVLSVFKTDSAFQIRKFATLTLYQNHGIGTVLLNYIIEQYSTPLLLNARIEKVSFYQKFGFESYGHPYDKNGHTYLKMIRHDSRCAMCDSRY